MTCPKCGDYAYRIGDTVKIVERCIHCDYEKIITNQRKQDLPVEIERRNANHKKEVCKAVCKDRKREA